MSLFIPDFTRLSVLVVGDLMVDQYWFGPTSRISPEAPVPVVRVTAREDRAGGAANVVMNLLRLGAQTRCCGVVGNDAAGDELQALLQREGAQTLLVRSPRHPTITKLRVLSRNQQLIRLDTEQHCPTADAAAVADLAGSAVADCDVCILSDYGKGALAEVAQLIAACRAAGVPVLVDPKGTDFSRYRGATLLTPNLAEFEAVAGQATDDDDLVARAQALRADLDLEYLIVTLSERGMLVVADDVARRLPARARQVFDVTGAGDTVIGCLATGLAAGLGIEAAAELANLAASLVVAKIGAAAVTPAELNLALHEQGEGGRGLLTREQAIAVARETRERGERLVVTNGCFDILHKGHVAYLQEAKQRGDRLMVAVNTDASVARLKGPERPINPLADRMAVLAGLAAVDWVVPFAEDTPADLIAELLPDVLVKGGDYAPEAIAGARAVLENGGTVEVLSFHEGRSTSALVAAIRGDAAARN
ncbi:MAG: bifunctional D-glycero-beta-D-manno-heptose-7-phosphate kinase/D-glycero-beta-D-manno-heptose 1-phosphate adenylyltransferase HldE [Gammaproteobacteria bacterium]|jgi:D-beta-D-heptose 7-phosphate kinase/D-beta-D-heptose 1-phosphate adenosyltransferase|nr:bifunctional D-glycero-beta-D-manno-heptose-7-phosphate kinase/D-glycero-beta-D-manno-heptose 1-phosphate adenylyltransferase HldE [Gammaproteobacteria bacterium]